MAVEFLSSIEQWSFDDGKGITVRLNLSFSGGKPYVHVEPGDIEYNKFWFNGSDPKLISTIGYLIQEAAKFAQERIIERAKEDGICIEQPVVPVVSMYEDTRDNGCPKCKGDLVLIGGGDGDLILLECNDCDQKVEVDNDGVVTVV